MRRPILLLLLVVTVAVACSEPLEFADWTIPVPEGTPIIEYAGVSIKERAGRSIEIERDLVIGGGDDSETTFYQPADLAVDDDGRIWVLDARKFQVEAFDPDGRRVGVVGKRGQGPGELESPQAVAIAADQLFVITNHRMSVWNLAGDYLHRVAIEPVNQLYAVAGGASGDLLLWHRVFGETRFTSRSRVNRLAADGTALAVLFDVPEPRAPTSLIDGEERPPRVTLGWWIPRVAMARSGALYATGADEYQIMRIEPDGEVSWALRVDWPRTEISDEELQSAFAELRQQRPEATPDDVFSWGKQPALDGIAVDGHGNVWVFPWVRDPLQRDERPVDVYAPDGRRLFAGMMAVRRRINILGEYAEDLRWLDALDDHIYSFGVDPRSEEHIVVRYRVRTEFD